jgi:hypothetical protein
LNFDLQLGTHPPSPVFKSKFKIHNCFAMDILLNAIEARVLGSLAEKETTTPEYYPLSLNALVNACNQKSSRDPVMNLREDEVREALHALSGKGLAGPASGADSRVTKYEHRLQEKFNFTRGEAAIICVLLLRGAQTPGELRGRTERVHHFEELADVQSSLQRLINREPPLVKMLPRQPGTKEARYLHLFCGDIEVPEPASAPASHVATGAAENARIARLEEEVVTLRTELAEVKQQLAEFRKQFE